MNTEQTPREIAGCAKIAPFERKLALAQEWAEELKDWMGSDDAVYDARIERVENMGYDGFIPYTEGGFDVIGTATLDYCHGSGSCPKLLQPLLDSILKDAEAQWDEEHPECTVAMIYGTHDDPEQPQLPGTPPRPEAYEAQREEWYEFESEWLQEGTTFFYKARVLLYDVGNHRNESGEPEMLFCVGINDDLEYGRDSISWLKSPKNGGPGTHWLWEANVPLSKLTKRRLTSLIKQAKAALENG